MRSITAIGADPRVRAIALTCYYASVLAALMAMAAHGAFTTPSFVYQGF